MLVIIFYKMFWYLEYVMAFIAVILMITNIVHCFHTKTLNEDNMKEYKHHAITSGIIMVLAIIYILLGNIIYRSTPAINPTEKDFLQGCALIMLFIQVYIQSKYVTSKLKSNI